MAEITAASLLLEQLKDTHQGLEMTMDGVTDEVAAAMPPGIANPIAGTYAHLVFSEDFFVQGLLQKKPTLFDGGWKARTGMSENQPTDWQEAYPKWLKEVKVDVKQAREYAKAVYAESEAYVASLTEADLKREVDMSAFGMGTRTVASVLASIVIGHTSNICGEVSVLKGIQGLKGYPW